MIFINRINELEKLKKSPRGLTVLFGRRRVGKTALIKEYTQRSGAGSRIYYSQAIEGAESLQVSQLLDDFQGMVPDISIATWQDFFALLKTVSHPCTVIIDEFPYLVKTTPSLPSRLQKWLDHDAPKALRLVLLGSSQTMMHDIFLNSHSPLFERAGEIIHVQPMGYRHFCQKLAMNPAQGESYLRFALVGGVPKYWDYIDPKLSVIELADRLYFEVGSRLESEPERLLKDENIAGDQAKSILELIGRGVHRPSEIAARMGIKQPSLSPPLQLLRDASLIRRETPFGESERSTKRSLYKIYDHCLSFWYGCYSPHRSRWDLYDRPTKQKLIYDHGSKMFEVDIRNMFPHASRYWEGGLELDSVRLASADGRQLTVSEIKMTKLTPRDRDHLSKSTLEKFQRCNLARQYEATVEIIDLAAGLKLLGEAK